jgi:hypothetical protein
MKNYNAMLPNLRQEKYLGLSLQSGGLGPYPDPRGHMIRPTKSFPVIKSNRQLSTCSLQ